MRRYSDLEIRRLRLQLDDTLDEALRKRGRARPINVEELLHSVIDQRNTSRRRLRRSRSR